MQSVCVSNPLQSVADGSPVCSRECNGSILHPTPTLLTQVRVLSFCQGHQLGKGLFKRKSRGSLELLFSQSVLD